MRKIFTSLSLLFFFGFNALSQDGSLLLSFSGDGKATTPLNAFTNSEYAMAIQSDGKVVVGANGRNGNISGIALVRYNTDGSLDNTFDNDGIVIRDFGFSINDIAIQNDGKIIVTVEGSFMVVRFNPDGSVDNTFDGDAQVTLLIGSANARVVKIQNDGKILLAGSASINSGDFLIYRLNPNGSLDNSFGGDGIVTTEIGGGESVREINIQSDGKIVAAGTTSFNGNSALVRYNADGTLDNTFGGGDGIATSTFANGIRVMALQPDGKIVVGGSFTVQHPRPERVHTDAAIARYNSDGSVDFGMKTVGYFTFHTEPFLDFFNDNESVLGIAVQSDGKILTVGTSHVLYPDRYNFMLLRFDNTGTLDPTFGVGGKVITDFEGGIDFGTDIALHNNIIYAAGFSGPAVAVAAYQIGPDLIPVPVKFVNLKASKKADDIEVSFSNLTESDVVKYNIERSGNGRQFSSIKELSPTKNDGGKADYRYTDQQPLSGVNLYRIKSLETNGKISYSAVAKVDLEAKDIALTIAPNPAKSTEVGMQITNLPAGHYKIRIFNNSAQVVSETILKHSGGSISQTLPLKRLHTGMYYLELNGVVKMRKQFIVQ